MGGDGGLMMTLLALQDYCEVDKLIFCVLPFGSGNDLAQVLNWGKDSDERYLAKMITIVKEVCMNSYEDKLNIWEMRLEFMKRGDIFRVGSNRRD